MRGDRWSTAARGAAHNRNRAGDRTLPCGRPALVHPLAACGALVLHLCPSVPQEAPDPRHEAPRHSELQEAGSQETVVHRVMGPGEIEGQEDVLLCAGAVRSLLAAGLRDVPAILDLLDEAADVVFHRPPRPESHLFRRDHPFALHQVGQPGQDHPLYQLAEVAGERNRSVAGDSLLVPPGLRDGGD